MKTRGSFIIICTFITILTLGYFFLNPFYNHLSSYLSKSEQVKANVLIVEGWLPDAALDMAFEEFQKNGYEYIITTGLKSSSDYYELSVNGYLIFHPKIKKSSSIEVSQHIIEVYAYGSLNGEYSAHFNLFVNNSLIADFLADKHKRRYSATWKGSLSEIDSIMVQFTNDKVDEYGDINLFIKEVLIDHNIIIPYLNNSEFYNSHLDGNSRIVNNFNSVAELARNWLLSKGIDSSSIIAVPGERVIINRTLTSALAFRAWLRTTNIDIKGINIISLGTHARRTWMTFNKILDEKYDIGIISIPEPIYRHSRERKVFKTVRETLGIIYYWFILIPY